MPRDAEPWEWDARKGYYAWVNGSRRRLCHLSEGKRAAKRRLAELLDEAGRAPAAGADLTVGDLCALYLADLRRRRDAGELEAGSRKDVVRRLADFPEAHIDLPAGSLRPHHVETWLAGKSRVKGKQRKPWGPTTRHDAVGTVKAVLSWARKAGHIDADPIAGMDKPQRARRRELVLSGDQWPAVRAAILSPHFRDLAEFLHETGARPGEAFRLEARHVDTARRVAVLSAREHKSGRKTGKTRAVYLSARAVEIVTRLAALRPTGAIFLNGKGRPWNKDSVNCQVRGVRKRAGVGNELVAYALRHLFATDSLDKGVPVETVAGMLGHSNSLMVSNVYSRLNDRHEHFLDAVDKVRGGAGESTDG